MSKLKIYMCSGVGDAKDAYRYWLDGTNTATNTRAVNSILARINELCAELDYMKLTPDQQLKHYNDIDVLVIALQFAKQFTGDNEALTKAGAVIQQLINDGEFNYKSLDDNERSSHLDTVFAAAGNSVHSNGAVSAAGDFYKWWLSFVIPNNRYGLPETKQQQLIQALKPQNIGATEDDFKRDYGDIGVYLYNSADYFLYLWIPENKTARLPYFLKKKIRKQQEIYRYVSQVFTALYGGEEDMQRIMRTRIIAQTGHTPEEAIDQLLGTRGIGLSESIIALIIIVAAAATLAILGALINAVTKVIVAEYAVPENIEDGCPEETDWPDSDETKQKLLKFGAIGLLLYFLFK